jgi:hypothetical protein
VHVKSEVEKPGRSAARTGGEIQDRCTTAGGRGHGDGRGTTALLKIYISTILTYDCGILNNRVYYSIIEERRNF